MVSRRLGAGLVILTLVLAALWLFNTVSDYPINTAGVINNPDETAGLENVIEITSSGFSPETLTVSVGETVTFVNKDTEEHWPATDLHPTHTVYPESDIKKCFDDSADKTLLFDSCRGLEQRETWGFTFTEKGNWDYHDHRDANLKGTIIVE